MLLMVGAGILDGVLGGSPACIPGGSLLDGSFLGSPGVGTALMGIALRVLPGVIGACGLVHRPALGAFWVAPVQVLGLVWVSGQGDSVGHQSHINQSTKIAALILSAGLTDGRLA
jgi:hypothetical protein